MVAVLTKHTEFFMEKDAKEALQVTKEIMVKFIELRRVSPESFAEIFPSVYQVVLETITRPNTGGKIEQVVKAKAE